VRIGEQVRRVVVGEALIDAHHLESRVAIYPRVVVSPRVYSKVPVAKRRSRLLEDRDGILHVDYFSEMVRRTQVQGAGGTNRNEWVKSALAIIQGNIDTLHGKGKLTELAKWAWFKDRLTPALESAAQQGSQR
jgi:hypothetical protein